MQFLLLVWLTLGMVFSFVGLIIIGGIFSDECFEFREKVVIFSITTMIMFVLLLPAISILKADMVVKNEVDVMIRTRDDIDYHIMEAILYDTIRTGNFERTFGVAYTGQKVSYQYLEKDTMFYPKCEDRVWVIVSDTPEE